MAIEMVPNQSLPHRSVNMLSPDSNATLGVSTMFGSAASEHPLSWLRTTTGILTLTTILLSYVGVRSTLKRAKKYRQKQERAAEFKTFATERKLARTQKSITYTFFSSMRHKLNLLLNLGGDLLEKTAGKDFAQYGPTHALYDQYGLTKVIHTIEPTNVHTILSSRAEDYGIPAARLSAIGPVGSKGVVMTEGSLWLQNRKAINRGFRGARFTSGIEENIQTFFNDVATPNGSDGWTTPIPLFDAFAMMSLDRSIKHMFGVREDLQGTSAESAKRAVEWKESFDVMAEFVSVRSVLGTMSWLYDGPAFRRSCTQLRQLCDRTIETAVKSFKQGIPTEASFIGNLIHEETDVRRIRDITLDVFIAGHNMTAGNLAWLFFELEKRPDLYEDARQEVLKVFGTDANPKTEMTWDTLQKCEKMGWTIYETMRLYPTLPNIGRQAAKDTILPTGGGEDGKQPVAVSKGSVVMCSLYLMHRRPQEWGADTGSFVPERWNGRTPGHEYAPFGGGPRICPGQLFGLVELFYVTARIMQRFKAIRQPPDGFIAVKSSGAGVMIPDNRATLQLLPA